MFDVIPHSLMYTLVFVIGSSVGSFLNVVAHRLPKRMMAQWRAEAHEVLELPAETELEAPLGLAWPPSACPNCKQAIRPQHNIPVLGYLALGGRCKDCEAPISPRYPLVELATGVVFTLVVWKFGLSLYAAAVCGFSAVLIVAALIDADTTLLPDELTLGLLWAGIMLSLTDQWPLSTQDALLGAAGGYLFLWSVFWLFKILTGKDGMGYGDFKLLAALGAWTGWQSLVNIILVASVIGLVFGVGAILSKKLNRDQPMPFGPYLAGAGWVALMFGLDHSVSLF